GSASACRAAARGPCEAAAQTGHRDRASAEGAQGEPREVREQGQERLDLAEDEGLGEVQPAPRGPQCFRQLGETSPRPSSRRPPRGSDGAAGELDALQRPQGVRVRGGAAARRVHEAVGGAQPDQGQHRAAAAP
ncbi:unnamed protein product, partial [Prorocentrum cordatum]